MLFLINKIALISIHQICVGGLEGDPEYSWLGVTPGNAKGMM